MVKSKTLIDTLTNSLNNLVLWIYTINILICIYTSVIYIKRDDIKFIVTAFSVTVLIVILLVFGSIFSKGSSFVCGNDTQIKFFILIYLYITYKIDKVSKLLSFLQIFGLIIVYLVRNNWNKKQTNDLEKKFNQMCYGKKQLDGLNSKIIHGCKSLKSKPKIQIEKMMIMMRLIKLSTMVPIQTLKYQDSKDLELIISKRMNKYGLNLSIVDNNSMEFIRLWIQYIDDFGGSLSQDVTIDDLFLMYHIKKFNLNKYGDLNNSDTSVMIFWNLMKTEIDGNDLPIDASIESKIKIKNRLNQELNRYRMNLNTLEFMGCKNLWNLYRIRKKGITIDESIILSMEQSTIDSILNSNDPNIDYIVNKTPDCYNIISNDFDINQYQSMVAETLGIHVKELKHLNFDQLEILLNTYANKLQILFPFNEINLKQMYQSYLTTKPQVCSDPSMMELDMEILNTLDKLNGLSIRVDCGEIQGLNYYQFKKHVDENYLKGKTYLIRDIMDPILYPKIKTMEQRGLKIHMDVLKTLSIPNIIMKSIMDEKKFDNIDNTKTFQLYSNVISKCNLDDMELNDLQNKELSLITNACSIKIPYQKAVQDIENIDMMILYKLNDLSYPYDDHLRVKKTLIIEHFVKLINTKRIKLHKIKGLMEFTNHDTQNLIIKSLT